MCDIVRNILGRQTYSSELSRKFLKKKCESKNKAILWSIKGTILLNFNSLLYLVFFNWIIIAFFFRILFPIRYHNSKFFIEQSRLATRRLSKQSSKIMDGTIFESFSFWVISLRALWGLSRNRSQHFLSIDTKKLTQNINLEQWRLTWIHKRSLKKQKIEVGELDRLVLLNYG